jgi:hypothetical protein
MIEGEVQVGEIPSLSSSSLASGSIDEVMRLSLDVVRDGSGDGVVVPVPIPVPVPGTPRARLVLGEGT